MHKIFLSSYFLFASARRNTSSRRCTESDIDQLGGGSAAIISSLETCVPDIITESTMNLIEGCVEVAFVPENLSQNCKACSLKFLENQELELKSCLMKCSGPSRQSHLCLKCKETVENLWDHACLPREQTQLDESTHSGTIYSYSIPLLFPIISNLF
jgi:hypothetical protein